MVASHKTDYDRSFSADALPMIATVKAGEWA